MPILVCTRCEAEQDAPGPNNTCRCCHNNLVAVCDEYSRVALLSQIAAMATEVEGVQDRISQVRSTAAAEIRRLRLRAFALLFIGIAIGAVVASTTITLVTLSRSDLVP